jgi:hypothetical protein
MCGSPVTRGFLENRLSLEASLTLNTPCCWIACVQKASSMGVSVTFNADFAFEPLALRIQQRDESHGSVTNERRQEGQVIEFLLRWRIQNVISIEDCKPMLEFIG